MIILTGVGWWIISQMHFIFGWWFLDIFWMLNWNILKLTMGGSLCLMFLWRRLQTYIANPRIRSPSVFAHAWHEAGWTQGGLGYLRPTWHFCNLSSVNRWLENHLKASGDCRTRCLASCWSSCKKSLRPKFFEAHVRTSWLEMPTSENNTLLNQCWLWRIVNSKSEIIGKKLSISVAYPCLQLGGQIAHEGAQVGLQEAIIERAHNLQQNLIKHQSIWVRRLHPMCWSELCWLVWYKQPGSRPSVLLSWASLQVGRQKWRPAERHDMCPWAEWYGIKMKQDKISYF